VRREDLPPPSGVFSSAMKTRPRFRSQRIARTRSLPAMGPHSHTPRGRIEDEDENEAPCERYTLVGKI
jgi:hypothetical protein